MSTIHEQGQEPGSSSPELFARRATGLVRDLKGWQQVAFNYIAAIPPLILAFTVFFALTGFPGGNFLIGILLALPFALVFAYSFGMMSAVIPRSGGDYVIVSRILHPAVGLVSSCCSVLAVAIGCAFTAQAFTTLGLAPSLSITGLVTGNHTLFDWGATIASSKGWQFGIGAVVLAVSGVIIGVGWRWTKRLLFGLLTFSIIGLAFSAIVALLTSKAGFISHFDSFARPFTGSASTYQDVIKTAGKSGVNVHPAFSLAKTLPLIGVIGSFSIYFWGTAYIAGEVRQGGTIKMAHRMAFGAFACLATIFVAVAIFFNGWGQDFLTAAYGGSFPKQLGQSPAYFFLTSAQLGSAPVTVLLVLSFLGAFLASLAYLLVEMSRSLFAWSVDGVLPRRISDVSRSNAPVPATILSVIICVVVYVWAVFVTTSLFEVATYSTLIQIIAMVLVAVCNIVLPSRHPALFRGSASTATIGGVPVIRVVGSLAILAAAVMYYLYFKYGYFGLANKGQFFIWVAGTGIVGLGIYAIARAVRRSQGVNLDLTYAEIPPE